MLSWVDASTNTGVSTIDASSAASFTFFKVAY
jgi:hypothetical protein